MGSLLFNHSSGFAARNKRQDQDYNMEGTNIWSDAWVAGINQTVNNMEGPLPFTPRFEFKVSANYTIPKIEVDLGIRFRFHNGRPVWKTEEIPLTINQWSDLSDAEFMAHAVLTHTAGMPDRSPGPHQAALPAGPEDTGPAPGKNLRVGPRQPARHARRF